MKKRDFYIFKEDLVNYKASHDNMTISQLVEELNVRFCTNHMKKLKTISITNYLLRYGYLYVDEGKIRRPTQKGKLLGIHIGDTVTKSKTVIRTNLYSMRAQQYILDNFYKIIDNI